MGVGPYIFFALSAIILAAIARGLMEASRARVVEMYCQNCGTVAAPKKRVRGSFWIEVVLWICLIIPGLIYSVWRLTSKQTVCPACGAPDIIPVTSPKARAALGK